MFSQLQVQAGSSCNPDSIKVCLQLANQRCQEILVAQSRQDINAVRDLIQALDSAVIDFQMACRHYLTAAPISLEESAAFQEWSNVNEQCLRSFHAESSAWMHQRSGLMSLERLECPRFGESAASETSSRKTEHTVRSTTSSAKIRLAERRSQLASKQKQNAELIENEKLRLQRKMAEEMEDIRRQRQREDEDRQIRQQRENAELLDKMEQHRIQEESEKAVIESIECEIARIDADENVCEEENFPSTPFPFSSECQQKKDAKEMPKNARFLQPLKQTLSARAIPFAPLLAPSNISAGSPTIIPQSTSANVSELPTAIIHQNMSANASKVLSEVKYPNLPDTSLSVKDPINSATKQMHAINLNADSKVPNSFPLLNNNMPFLKVKSAMPSASVAGVVNSNMPVTNNNPIITNSAPNLTPSANSVNAPANPVCYYVKDQLPPSELIKFSGDPTKFQAFLLSFDSRILKQGASYEDSYNYLLQYTTGEARELVESCGGPNLTDSYNSAMETLKREYGNSLVVAQTYLKDLEAWPKVPYEDAKALKKFSWHLTKCRNLMKQMSDLD